MCAHSVRGEIISTTEDIMIDIGEYHEYIGDIQYVREYHEYVKDVQYIGGYYE